MKQILQPAQHTGSRFALALLMLTLTTFACATRARDSSAAAQPASDAPTAERASLINLNTASPEELEKLPGVGKVIAERIVAQRKQYGPFRRAEHLMMVRGISDRRFREMRPLIVVQ